MKYITSSIRILDILISFIMFTAEIALAITIFIISLRGFHYGLGVFHENYPQALTIINNLNAFDYQETTAIIWMKILGKTAGSAIMAGFCVIWLIASGMGFIFAISNVIRRLASGTGDRIESFPAPAPSSQAAS